VIKKTIMFFIKHILVNTFIKIVNYSSSQPLILPLKY